MKGKDLVAKKPMNAAAEFSLDKGGGLAKLKGD